MNSEEIHQRLSDAANSGDFIRGAEALGQNLQQTDSGLDSVTAILRFMEDNAGLDFGTPGPLVHYVERFCKKGYEGELLASLSRKPNEHTAWMLNRIINGTKESATRESLVRAMRDIEQHSGADLATKRRAAHFISRLS